MESPLKVIGLVRKSDLTERRIAIGDGATMNIPAKYQQVPSLPQ